MSDFNPLDPRQDAAEDCPIVPAPALSRSSSHSAHSQFPAAGALAFLGAQSAVTTAAPSQTNPVYAIVHGHFYQPPRENPYLEAIAPQPSAAPFHNWNERILDECYRPNAFARILDDRGHIEHIVNNFELMSFNIGPTLMSWIERHDVEVYQRILAADRLSAKRLGGHGNAIAQVYNHIILPLASDRDKRTQIRWGIADFAARFQRQPEGMWLAETAIDNETVAILVEEGIRFVILAPSQAQRCRPLQAETHKWTDVSRGEIDPTRAYRCFVKPELRSPIPSVRLSQRDYLDIFFYDGPISGDLGFGELLETSHAFAERFALSLNGDRSHAQLLHCATDGETFGHHKHGKERTLAYSLIHEFPARGWFVTNYAHYLSQHPPQWEVEIKPRTAWSCAHGVGRWERDCGCASGGGYHQLWRQPLRQALNWLRDRLVEIYERATASYLADPWAARDAYIEVILNRTPERVESFLRLYQRQPLTPAERADTLRLLEMQRQSQLMFTSCGWFFEEISRPEGVQILSYAARAIDLAGEAVGVDLEPEFLHLLAKAPSNLEQFANGADVYRQHVKSAIVPPHQMAAHYAISSLFNTYARQTTLYSYTVEQLDVDASEPRKQKVGGATLAIGRIHLQSATTLESHDLIYAVLHLGGWDFHCCVQPFAGKRHYEAIQQRLWSSLRHGNRAEIAIAIQSEFGEEYFNLTHLFATERQAIMRLLNRETLAHLHQLYRQVYLDNYSVMLAFRQDGIPLPEELQAAASIALNQRLMACLQGMELDEHQTDAVTELRAIAAEAERLGCQLKRHEAADLMNRSIHRYLWLLVHDFSVDTMVDRLTKVVQWLELARDAGLELSASRSQELFLCCLERHIAQRCTTISSTSCENLPAASIPLLVRLGQHLHVAIDVWLARQPHST
ncbi:MAG: DUF3536 domain-containing protein [Cyanobacteria bacterium J06642_2]